MNTQLNHRSTQVEIVQKRGIFAPKTRNQEAVQWIFRRIKAGLFKYKVSVKQAAMGRVEELCVTVKDFPRWGNTYRVVYYVDPKDENQRDNALIHLFRVHGISMRNMCVFLSEGPIEIQNPYKRITEVLI